MGPSGGAETGPPGTDAGDPSSGPSGPKSGPADRLALELATPRAAAVAGIAFALILTSVVVLLHLALPDDGTRTVWISDASRRRDMTWALELIPYAGIAFLWFIGVIRTRLGQREDKLFATAFLGSGLLLVGLLFTAAATIGGVLALYGRSSGISDEQVRLVGATGTVLLATFGIRMAAVFTMVVTNLGRRTGVVPRWLQVVGYAAAACLLFAPPRILWSVLLFPAWVFLLSVQILVASLRDNTVGDAVAAVDL